MTVESPTVSKKEKPPVESHFQGDLPLWKRVLVCGGLLSLESYITYQEVYLTTTLQRMQVPYALLSLPGALSGGLGIFTVPLLGLAMDRFRGNNRLFALATLCLLTLGMGILIYTASISLYNPVPLTTPPPPPLNSTARGTLTSEIPATESFKQNVASWEKGLSVSAALAVIGFGLGDQGYDTSALSVRTYILSISPASQHDSLLLTMTMMGAVGGCLTSLIGFLNLSKLFPTVEGYILDEGDAQFLVQSIIFVVALFLAFISTLCCDTKWLQGPADTASDVALHPTTHKPHQTDHKPFHEDEEVFSECESERNLLVKGSMSVNGNYKSGELCTKSGVKLESGEEGGTFPALNSMSGNSDFGKHPTTELEERPAEGCSLPEKKERSSECISRWTKSKLCLMLMVFMVIIAMSSFFFYITNYVAEVIYHGDPHAPPGSDAYKQYVLGTRMASLSMLTFYGAFVVYNFIHAKILNKIGMKGEFIVTSLLVMGFTLVTVLMQSMVVLFLTMFPLAAYRSCCFTVPFILANKYAQQEHEERLASQASAGSVDVSPTPPWKSGGGDGTGSKNDFVSGKSEGESGDAHSSGSALAIVTMMFPVTYFLVSLGAGPLIALTEDTALPIYVSIGAYGLGTLTGFIVDFE